MLACVFVKICQSAQVIWTIFPGGVIVMFNVLDFFSQSFLPSKAEIIFNVLRLSRSH